jgi:3-mercaptopyruvate sulfurtransferase SseA
MTLLTDSRSASRYFKSFGVSNPASWLKRSGSIPDSRNLTPFIAGEVAQKVERATTNRQGSSFESGLHPQSTLAYPKSSLIAAMVWLAALITIVGTIVSIAALFFKSVTK